jgi:hypothetical protein
MDHTSVTLIEKFDTTLLYYCKHNLKYIFSFPVLCVILILIFYLYYQYQFSLLSSENSLLKIQTASLSDSISKYNNDCIEIRNLLQNKETELREERIELRRISQEKDKSLLEKDTIIREKDCELRKERNKNDKLSEEKNRKIEEMDMTLKGIKREWNSFIKVIKCLDNRELTMQAENFGSHISNTAQLYLEYSPSSLSPSESLTLISSSVSHSPLSLVSSPSLASSSSSSLAPSSSSSLAPSSSSSLAPSSSSSLAPSSSSSSSSPSSSSSLSSHMPDKNKKDVSVRRRPPPIRSF